VVGGEHDGGDGGAADSGEVATANPSTSDETVFSYGFTTTTRTS
jgi:hypothetical protein